MKTSRLIQPQALKWASLFLLIKVAILIAAFFWVESQGFKPKPCSWDCVYYDAITTQGYAQSLGSEHSNLAFFPAYPFLAKTFFAWISPSFAWQGIALNLFLFFFSSYLMMLWSLELGFKKLYYLPALLLTFDRFTLWTHVPYTESLFLFSLLSYFLILRFSPFGKWTSTFAALLGGFVSSIRIVGVSLIAGLGIARLRHYLRRPHIGALHLLLGLSGVLAFFTFLQLTRGDWGISIRATSNWQREFSVLGIFKSIWLLLKFFYFPTVIVFACALYGIFSKKNPLKLRNEERITCFFLLFIPMASTVQISLTRYMTMVVLAYPIWAYFLQHIYERYVSHPNLQRAWVALWSLILILEIYWQWALTCKFLRAEVFLWAS